MSLSDLILFAAIPRRDVKPLAKSLLDRFGNVSGVDEDPRKATHAGRAGCARRHALADRRLRNMQPSGGRNFPAKGN